MGVFVALSAGKILADCYACTFLHLKDSPNNPFSSYAEWRQFRHRYFAHLLPESFQYLNFETFESSLFPKNALVFTAGIVNEKSILSQIPRDIVFLVLGKLASLTNSDENSK
jgi:hypothetical protein